MQNNLPKERKKETVIESCIFGQLLEIYVAQPTFFVVVSKISLNKSIVFLEVNSLTPVSILLMSWDFPCVTLLIAHEQIEDTDP